MATNHPNPTGHQHLRDLDGWEGLIPEATAERGEHECVVAGVKACIEAVKAGEAADYLARFLHAADDECLSPGAMVALLALAAGKDDEEAAAWVACVTA